MFFNENKRKRLHNNTVKFPEDLVGAPTWPPFLCLGHQHGGRDVMQMFTGLQKLNDYRSYGITVDLLGQYS